MGHRFDPSLRKSQAHSGSTWHDSLSGYDALRHPREQSRKVEVRAEGVLPE
ncbi:MAG: hypothetical protein ABSG98_06080 [Anaerolineales bacterium]